MLLFLDFETYYDQVYSLRNKEMTPADYILDDRFEAIMLGTAVNDEKGVLIDGPDIPHYLKTLDPSRVTTVTFNALFDNSILAYRYGFVPHRMVDGLGMARALLGSRLRRLGLAEVLRYLELRKKETAVLGLTKGMRRADLITNPPLWNIFGAYCLDDTEGLRDVFDKLRFDFPKEEYAVMDAVLRTCIQPAFHCDVQLLKEHLNNIRMEKDRLCAAAGAERDAISGNLSFIAALEARGVEVQTKPGKKGPIPAIAKTDGFMQSLLEHEDTEVQCLAAARLGVKSTLEERRSERLISIASLPWPSQAPMMPIPLRYSGAHTWRLSGDWKINMQNLPSARMGDPVLRKALLAPPGYKVVVGDLAQIEARLTAWFCGCDTLLTEFRDKLDPYSALASIIFGQRVDKTTMDGVARHIGKAGVLGCGYGLGAGNFYKKTLAASTAQFAKKPEILEKFKSIWTPQLAEDSVNAYRSRYNEVRQMWSRLNWALEGPWMGKAGVAPFVRDPIRIFHRDGAGIVSGPGGREIRYPSPLVDQRGDIYWFYGGVPSKLYGAALLENIIQFLARVVMFDAAVRLQKEHGLRFVHQVHDELVFIVPDAEVDAVAGVLNDKGERVGGLLRAELKKPPAWAPALPLDCDIGSAQRYGDCK